MPDNIVNLSFTNDPLYANNSNAPSLTYSGSIEVDFTSPSTGPVCSNRVSTMLPRQ